MIKKLVLAVSFAVAPMLANASANLLTNGSFEAPDIPNGTWTIFSSVPGWSASSLGVEVRDNVAGTASDGTQYVELDTTGNSWISQSVATTAGTTYSLSFDYAPRMGVPSNSNGIEVFWNGVSLGSVTGNGVGHTDNYWNTLEYSVIGVTGFSTLKFAAIGTSNSLGGSLDAVALTVPEPETYAMLLAGLGLMGAVARRRRMA